MIAGAFTAVEREWMAQALALGAIGGGRASPNPRVGCLVVQDGRVVGSGYHRAPGDPHAEAIALERAGALARNATLYVNLEPCAHHGRTPPCTQLLVPSGIRAVVAAMQDPNPLVDGRGFAELRRAGIDVRVGLLEPEARALNEAFVHWHATRRPLCTLKAALSADGMIAGAAGESRWITGVPARTFAHGLRSQHDAILVGAGTIRRDDPRLTVRLGGPETARRRVVLASTGALDPRARVFDTVAGAPRTRVYVGRAVPSGALAELSRAADVVQVAEDEPAAFLGAVLDDLGQLGVQSVLVEGGARTTGAFLGAGLAQRFAFFHSSGILGSRGATALVDLPAVGAPALAHRLEREQLVPLGDDLLVLGRIVGRGDSPRG